MKILLSAFVMLLAAATGVRADVITGQPAPNFTLADTNGTNHSLSDYKGKFVVLEWINPDCPFVKKHYGSGNMQGLQKKYTGQGVIWLSIDSSAPGTEGHYPPDKINDWAKKMNSSANALFVDDNGKVARIFGAKTTPHMFIIDPKGTLVYQGAIDSVPSADKADIAGAKNFVQMALDESMAGKSVSNPSTKSYGCSVKYQ
jgi:hypothetical protein